MQKRRLQYGFWEDGRDEHCDTVAAKGTEGQGESKREEKGKTKGEEEQMSTATVAAKGTEGADIILIIYNKKASNL